MKASGESSEVIDPRINIIDKRLETVKRIIAVSSGKGGVGKSLVASTLALALAGRGYKVGLFDADFTSPSTHRILGAEKLEIREEKGVMPADVHGLKYMSIVAFSSGRTLPLRGVDVSNILIEILSTTIWGDLDFLIIDMPPGISDATLDLVRLVRNMEFLLVCTPSPLAFETVRKLLTLLKELKLPVVGVIENMKIKQKTSIKDLPAMKDIRFLGEIPFDPKVEDALGNVDSLSQTVFAEKVAEIALKITSSRA